MRITEFSTLVDSTEREIEIGNQKGLEKIDSKFKASYLCYQLLKDQIKEHQLVIFLGIDLDLIGYEIIATGTDTEVISNPKSMLAGAIKANASFLITAHNHTLNRKVAPSQSDKQAYENKKKRAKF